MLSGRAAQADEFSSLVLSLALLVTAAKMAAIWPAVSVNRAWASSPPECSSEPARFRAASISRRRRVCRHVRSARHAPAAVRGRPGAVRSRSVCRRRVVAVGRGVRPTVSFALGWSVAAQMLPAAPGSVHIFLAAAITATSVGITARVLKDLRASRGGKAKIILGAAVVDDILALVVLGLVTGGLAGGTAARASEWRPAVALVAKTIGFLTLAIVLGVKLTPQWFRQAARLRAPVPCSRSVCASVSFCPGRRTPSALPRSSAPLQPGSSSKTVTRGLRVDEASGRWASCSSRADVVPRADLLRTRRLSHEP